MYELVSKNLSYSLIKAFSEDGPNALIERKFIDNAGIDFGKKLDDLVFLSKEEFNDKYLVIENLTLNKEQCLLAEKVYTEKLDITDITDSVIDKIIEYITELDLFKRVKKLETKLTKFNFKEFYDYIILLQENSNKIVIDNDEYVTLLAAKHELFTNKTCKNYFNVKGNVELLDQFEYIFEYKNKNLKVVLDRVIINHDNKTITPLDLKTGANDSKDFIDNFFKFKYYLQGGLYIEALNHLINNKYPGYTLIPFKFIYVPRFKPSNVKTFILTEKWYEAAWNGFNTLSGYRYKGLDELINEISWHISHEVFDQPKDFYLNNEVFIKDDFINL